MISKSSHIGLSTRPNKIDQSQNKGKKMDIKNSDDLLGNTQLKLSGFGHNKITSNKPWNTETHKTDRNPPITNHKQWPFEPVEENFRFLRGPLRWWASDIFLTRGSKCTNHRKTVLIACFLRGHLNLLFSLFYVHFLFLILWLVDFARSSG